jgi:hypothetical protein
VEEARRRVDADECFAEGFGEGCRDGLLTVSGDKRGGDPLWCEEAVIGELSGGVAVRELAGEGCRITVPVEPLEECVD